MPMDIPALRRFGWYHWSRRVSWNRSATSHAKAFSNVSTICEEINIFNLIIWSLKGCLFSRYSMDIRYIHLNSRGRKNPLVYAQIIVHYNISRAVVRSFFEFDAVTKGTTWEIYYIMIKNKPNSKSSKLLKHTATTSQTQDQELILGRNA